MKNYDHKKIELKIQKEWEKKKIYQAKEGKGKKFYSLIEFPYPSGDGLHVGHPRPYIGMDVISRKRRMEGFNVLYPIGWDAFGLPTENYAIKTGIHPKIVTKKNTDNFTKQIKSLGISFDWSREINTTDPKYYKWTQWIFLQFFKKGLAYKTKSYINWCPKDKIGLANEEAVGGICDRCGTATEKREKEQWMLGITKYAERLDKDLDLVDYPERVKTQQRNWIGKSEGSEIEFKISTGDFIKVFTTRADTLFGATYVVLAPEHDLISKIKSRISNWTEVEKYIKDTKNKSELERTSEDKTKTGVEIKGIKAINPANGEEVPIWIADYVLVNYGTGAVMAVPAHDERDFEFAKKYNLPIKQVIMPRNFDVNNPPLQGKKDTKREVVHVILRNTKNKTILIEFLKGEEYKNIKHKNFIIGGIEDGESELEAATREIKEETGYVNIKFIKKVPFEAQAEFFAAHKDLNRIVHTTTLIFDLVNEEKVEISEEEKNIGEGKWISEKDVAEILTIPNDKMTWEYLQKGGFAFVDDGILINSDKFNNLISKEAQRKITEYVGGKMVNKFKLRDWVFSRQRYWGEPIPIINCEKCGLVAVPEKDLPVKLPEVKSYKPTDNGESPLASISKWVNTKCPKCKGKAKRETDTMPNWAGSSWYYLRYTDPKNTKVFADKKKLKYWTPVDWYNGGMEHTTLHLLYSRFWHKFLYDLKLVPTTEPYKKRTSHGMILGEGGVKMSKSLGNVINPDDIVKTYGADTLRVYEMFIGPFEDSVAWSTESIIGSRRFLERVWNIQYKVQKNKKYTEFEIEKAVKKVTEDIEGMKFNTAISTLMIFINEIGKLKFISQIAYEKFLKILSPFAPHITEEIWSSLGNKKSIHFSSWPKWDKDLVKDEEIKIAVQVNGKVRAEVLIQMNEGEESVKEKVLANPSVLKYLSKGIPKKVIYVKNRVINILG